MKPLIFPPKILDQHLIALGKTGVGKSSALRHAVEWLLNKKERVCVVDPKGDWWGLKSSADGKHAGFEVITFGDFKNPKATDIPINKYSGKEIADLVASGNRPLVIGLRGWMPATQAQFWVDFASTIFNSNSCGGLHLVIDEIQNFAPKERMGFDRENLALHWTKRLLSEGRGLGLSILSGSQRPQSVHNGVLTQCETLLAMRLIHDADCSAVENWLKRTRDKNTREEIMTTLPDLARGEAWIWSPEAKFGPVRMKFPMFDTFDSFAPIQLQRKVNERSWADVDLTEVKAKLATVIEEAKARDPKALQAQIVILNKEIERLKKGQDKGGKAAPMNDEEFERRVATAAAADLADAQEHYTSTLAQMQKAYEDLIGLTSETFDGINKLLQIDLDGKLDIVRRTFLVSKTARAATTNWRKDKSIAQRAIVERGVFTIPAPEPGNLGSDVGHAASLLDPRHQQILNTLRELEVLGVKEPDRTVVAVFAGRGGGKSNSFANDLSKMSAQWSLISYPRPGKLALTAGGRKLAHEPEQLHTLADFHDQWFRILPARKAKILKVLINRRGSSIDRDSLAAKTERGQGKSNSFANDLSSMRTLGLIEYPVQGEVEVSDLLFPEGLK